ncbi:hypothetical protein BDZ89DRAFT_1057900 [Hymenopellis radicata]|nr:hypothetical protein BDZ89DRAFT_1057900 [Hymenopellis radicata]
MSPTDRTIDPRPEHVQTIDLYQVGVAGPSSFTPPPGKKRIAKATEYSSSQEMLNALKSCFLAHKQVDFAGTYTVANNPPILDKQRIKHVANDIWKACGYRFTVKDHPQINNGHKTRMWCSQDDAHVHRHPERAILALNETAAKKRYPCRSRLLISSCDVESRPDSRVVTVRLHHFAATGHEPYQDMPLQILPVARPPIACPSTSCMPPLPPPHATWSTLPPPPLFRPIPLPPAIPRPVLPPPRANPPPDADKDKNDAFQKQMRTHISNIRDFCDGLEYQLQFNDHRLLEELEGEGGGFLGFVHSCLRREGRLRQTEDNMAAPVPPRQADTDESVLRDLDSNS